MLEQTVTHSTHVISATSWEVLRFGKHEGKTLPQVLLTDPKWFFWAHNERKFRGDVMSRQAAQLGLLATRIKIPDNEDQRLLVEYALTIDLKSLAYVRPVYAVEPKGLRRFRQSHFDLSFPSRHNLFGKRNGLVVVRAIKQYVMRDADAVMTKRRCEQFFENTSYFDLPGPDHQLV